MDDAFNDATLPTQFVLGRTDSDVPARFGRRTLHGWTLQADASLPVIPVHHGDAQFGWLLGWPIEQGRLLTEADTFTLNTLPSADPNRFESQVYAMSGRWALLLLHGDQRVYLDASASLAAVYEPDSQRVGATTTALLWPAAERTPAPPVLAANRSYAFGITSARGIYRILPNHYLDLDTWDVVRHWPIEHAPRAIGTEVNEVFAAIGTAIRHTLTAAHRSLPLLQALTSGRESRMLLAGSYEFISDIDFMTLGPPACDLEDLRFAQQLQRRFGFRHHTIDTPPASAAERARYLMLVGHDASPGKATTFLKSASNLDPSFALVTGFGGGVGGAFYWRRFPSERVTWQQAHALLHQPDTAESRRLAQRWFEQVDPYDREELLDLLYLEQRMGAWASTQLYGFAPFAMQLMPLSQRSVYENFFRVPVATRRDKYSLARGVVRNTVPELDLIPYRRAPGAAGYVRGIGIELGRTKKMLRDHAGRAVRALQQRSRARD